MRKWGNVLFFLFCWVHQTVPWVCFSNPSSSFYLELLLFPLEQDFTLSFPPPPDKQDRYFGFADVCRGAIVFFNSCMSLPAPTPHLTTECGFLPEPGCLRSSSVTIRNGPGLHLIPQQHPGGTADNVQTTCSWTLSKMHVVKMIGLKQKHMVCWLHAELNTLIFEGCNLGQWMSKSLGDLYGVRHRWQYLYACVGHCSAVCASLCIWYLTVSSWVVSSSAQCTICSRSEAAHAAGALFHLGSF